jgi:hypothetical protein
MSLKNSVTPPGIDPGTVRLVAQRLSHYAMIIVKKYDNVIGDFHVRLLFELPHSIELNTLEVAHQSACFHKTPALSSSAVRR